MKKSVMNRQAKRIIKRLHRLKDTNGNNCKPEALSDLLKSSSELISVLEYLELRKYVILSRGLYGEIIFVSLSESGLLFYYDRSEDRKRKSADFLKNLIYALLGAIIGACITYFTTR